MKTPLSKKKSVSIKKSVIDSLLTYSQSVHPREGILLLRGKVKKDSVTITDIVIPPFATHGEGFSSFPLYTIPADFFIIGSAHSHPSGVLKPSLQDVTHLYGLITVIVGFPYSSEENVAVFDKEGEKTEFSVV